MNRYTIYFQSRKIEVVGDYLQDIGDYWQIKVEKSGINDPKTVAIVPKGVLITIELIK